VILPKCRNIETVTFVQKINVQHVVHGGK